MPSISGRIAAEELGELQKVVSGEETDHQKVDLDLKDGELVDRRVMSYLAVAKPAALDSGTVHYIREWIARETQAEGLHD